MYFFLLSNFLFGKIDARCTSFLKFSYSRFYFKLIFKVQISIYLLKNHYSIQCLNSNIVFGWIDFRGDGKYRKEN